MTHERFYQYFLKKNPIIECGNGLNLVWNGEFKTFKNRNFPMYEVDNPKNQPYTKEALSILIDDEISELLDYIPQSRIDKINTNLIIEGDVLYVPQYLLDSINKCLKLKKIDYEFGVPEGKIHLEGFFNGNFDLYAYDDEIHWDVDFKLIGMSLNGKKITDDDEMDEWCDFFRFERHLLEDIIWECVRDISEYRGFFQSGWMGWYTDVYFLRG